MVKSKLTLTFSFFRLKFYCLEHFLWVRFGQSLKILEELDWSKSSLRKLSKISQKILALIFACSEGRTKTVVSMYPKQVNEGSSQVCVNQLQIEFNQRGDPFFYFIQSAVETFWVLSNNKKHSHHTMLPIFASRKKVFEYFLRLLSSRLWCGCLKSSATTPRKTFVFLVTRRLVIQVSLGWMLWFVDSACCLIAVHCCSRGLKREVIRHSEIAQGTGRSFKF